MIESWSQWRVASVLLILALLLSGFPVPGLTGPAMAQDNDTTDQALTPIEEPRLAHIHAGRCEDLGIIVYELEGLRSYRTGGDSGDGAGSSELISGNASVPLSELFGEEFSVHVHESEPEKSTWLACAEVGNKPEAPWTESDGLVLRMKEQRESGYSGIARLRPSDDGASTEVTIALSTTPTSAATVEQAPAVPTSTYTSSTFGYEIGYGPPWQEAEATVAGGGDSVVLFNGSSYITFTGVRAFEGDPDECVDTFAAERMSDSRASNFRLDVDEDGNPSRGGTEATGAFVIYDHDYTFSAGVVPYTLFVACIPLIPNEAVLSIVQNVPTEDYDEQLELREALLRNLVLPQ
jgi:hypothetical protein